MILAAGKTICGNAGGGSRKKEEGISLIHTFSEFKETKNIDRTTMVGVLEESFRNVIAKIFGSDENFDVIVNPDKGDFEIYRNREIVADGDVMNFLFNV